ncbi:MAG: hypothetical protein QXV24_01710 [Nitrososphaerota archaeon]
MRIPNAWATVHNIHIELTKKTSTYTRQATPKMPRTDHPKRRILLILLSNEDKERRSDTVNQAAP